MREYAFGSGQLYATNTSGLSPVAFGVLQDVTITFSGDIKELHGQYGLPVAVGRGKQKVEIKAGNGDIDPELFNDIYFGQAATATGSYAQSVNEAGTVPGSGPYTVTVANSANFYRDLGVSYALTGVRLKQVASGPTVGQYSVSAGVYTFAAADTGLGMTINYIYTVATGKKLTITNQLIGTEPTFQLILAETFNSGWFFMQFNAVKCAKLGMPLKLDDFMIEDLEMSAFVDASGTLGIMSISVADPL